MVGTPDDDALAGLFFRPDLGSRSPTVVVKNSPTGHGRPTGPARSTRNDAYSLPHGIGFCLGHDAVVGSGGKVET
jgi:hypothetical protein